MKLTAQELMDLPNYGDAEKALRKQGDWDDTTHTATGDSPVNLVVAFEHGYSVVEDEPLILTVRAH